MKKSAREAVQTLMRIGGQMSNLCFNLSQPCWKLRDEDRKVMGQLYKQWDAAEIEVHKEMQPRKRLQEAP